VVSIRYRHGPRPPPPHVLLNHFELTSPCETPADNDRPTVLYTPASSFLTIQVWKSCSMRHMSGQGRFRTSDQRDTLPSSSSRARRFVPLDQMSLPAQLAAGAVASYAIFAVGRFVASRQPGDRYARCAVTHSTISQLTPAVLRRIITVPPNLINMILSPIWPPRGWIGCHWSHWIRECGLPWEAPPNANFTTGSHGTAAFDKAGTNVIPLIWPVTGERYVYVVDAAAVNAIFNDRRMFVKPVHLVCQTFQHSSCL